MKKILGYTVFAIIVTSIIGPYLYINNQLKILDASAQSELGGLYLRTKEGVLSYTRDGSKSAPVVILVHGFSTPKFVWDQITPLLMAANYQVISFDHLGRGFSDRPVGPYDAALYRSELDGLIDGLNLTTPLSLVGYSMGGGNIVDYAASRPERVNNLVLIAPAGYSKPPSSLNIMKLPLIGDWLALMMARGYVGEAIKSEVESGLAPSDMLYKFNQQAAYAGYSEALLSTLRHYPMHDLGERYKIVGETNIPVTVIWGTDDESVPFSGLHSMVLDVPQLQAVMVKNGKHNITYTEADLVAEKILMGLQRSDSSHSYNLQTNK